MRKALIGLLGVVALVSVTPTAHAAFPGLNGKIAFYTAQGTSDDIWVMQPDGSGQTAITGPSQNERDPAWSPDGTKIAFEGSGANNDIFAMNADGTGMVNLTNFSGGDFSPSWSPDGSKIVFASTRSGDFGQKIYVMDADGSDVTRITDAFTPDAQPAWSPDGRIAFVRQQHVFKMNADGSNITQVTGSGTSDHDPTWSPTGARIAYVRSGSSPATAGVHTIDADGSNDVDLTSALTEAHDPAWSPDGSKIVVSRNGHVWTMNANGSDPTQLTTVFGTNGKPDWQPLPYPGYPRPKGATPLRVSLVPAYPACSAPDRLHGPPLAFGSCSSPAQVSPNLTVGTPDANGAAANFRGSVRLDARQGTPGPPEDTGARAEVFLTDVRCNPGVATCGAGNAAGGADYIGEVQLRLDLRITDKNNAVAPGGGFEPATVTDLAISVPVQCFATGAATGIGATCSISTELDFFYPQIIKDTRRTIWQIESVRVFDGGPDGDVDTDDNTVFAVQGLFVP